MLLSELDKKRNV